MKYLIGLPERSEKVCLRGGAIEHARPLSRHAPQMNPDTGLEDPPGRGMWEGLTLLMGTGGLVGSQGLPEAIRHRRVAQQTSRHDHLVYMIFNCQNNFFRSNLYKYLEIFA
jgi:hypothetical protein